MNVWGQVITLRGQFLVSRIGDDTLRVLCCVLCVCALCVCVCVGVGVGAGAGVGVSRWPPLLSSTTNTHPPLSPCVRSKRSPCVHSKRPRVYQHHAAWCRCTRRRSECTHGVFQRATPHRTHTQRPQRHTHKTQQQPPPQHRDRQGQRVTERDRDRRQRKRDRERETRQDKTRQEGKRR